MDEQASPLRGKVAIVTGAGHGLGAQVAQALASAGAKVCVNDLNPDRAERTAKAITAGGGEAFGWQADVANKFQVAAMIEATRDRFGRLDILIQNAHVNPCVPALTMDEWEWRRTLEVNLTGAFLCAQLAGRVMSDEGGGKVVFLVRAGSPQQAGQGRAAFLSTQAALSALAEALEAELNAQGVRVYAVTARTPEETIYEVLALCSAG